VRPFRRIAIIGTGLIGGSIGLALRKKKIVRIGFDRPNILKYAKKIGAIDQKAKNVREAMDGSDLVLLAMPVGEILDLLPRLTSLVPPATLMTDVGSTKAEICRLAGKKLKNFIGGHPLVGKEKSGIENADSKLFVGKSWFLCPNGGSAAVARMKSFVRLLGARPAIVGPEKHDRILAATSHLPQLVSSLLAATVEELLEKDGNRIKGYAGVGLKDAVRLAASPFSVWKDVFSANSSEVGRALAQFAEGVNRISGSGLNLEMLEHQFEKANVFVRKLE